MSGESSFSSIMGDQSGVEQGKDDTDDAHAPLKSILRQISSTSQQSLNQPPKEEEAKEDDVDEKKPEVEAEKNETGKVGFSVYKNYYRLGGNCCTLLFLVSLFLIAQMAASASDMWVAFWTTVEQTRYESDIYINETLNETLKKGDLIITDAFFNRIMN
jgi:hypothetical protein